MYVTWNTVQHVRFLNKDTIFRVEGLSDLAYTPTAANSATK